MDRYDAVVVGAGPNGLAAAIAFAQAGRSVKVIEGATTVGGGARTLPLTLPGYMHDVCSAVHPLAAGSPFLQAMPLEDHGLKWIHPKVPFAHPISPSEAVMVHRSVAATVSGLGPADGEEYRRRIEPWVEKWDHISAQILGPPLRWPRYPIEFARFGLVGMLPARTLINAFQGEPAKALFAGVAAHAFMPLNRMLTASFGLLYPITAHRFGWPFAAGGSQAIVDAMASYLLSIGGEIETDHWVATLAELPESRVVMFDLPPEGLMSIAGKRLPSTYRLRLRRFTRAPAAFKVDYALNGPVPWTNPELAEAGTLHLGSSASITSAEAEIWRGRRPQRPFIILAQQSLFDQTRAPRGRHTLWAYAHVPAGTADDYSDAIESEIEALAPGFRDRIEDKCVAGPADLADYNPNLIKGDITGGAYTAGQIIFRPGYATPAKGIYMCSSSTPPGAGVHGMCGYWAARTALNRELK